MVRPLPLVLLSATLLQGCASADGDYPSLALRDAERPDAANRAPSTEGLALIDPAPPSAAVQAQIEEQVANARAAHRRFLAALPATRRAVAAGGGAPIESDAYAAAQVALGNLQTISSETAFALADLDALLAARSNALLSTGEVAAARETVTALVQEERAALDDLERDLR